MRILHTADWRLGRALHGMSLLAEQAAFIEQLIAAVRSTRADVVALLGGLVEPGAEPSARELFEHALGRLALDERVGVLAMVEGPSESPGRGVLERVGVHLVGEDVDPARRLVLTRGGIGVGFHCLPARRGREAFAAGLEAARSAVARAGAGARAGAEAGAGRRVLLARWPDGEGAGPALARVCRDFAGCLLGGRVDTPDSLPQGAWHAGPPLAEGFAEADRPLGFGLLVLEAGREPRHERVPFEPSRGLRLLRGSLAELLRSPPNEDQVRAQVEDRGLTAGLDRLRERLPGLREVERPPPAPGPGSLLDLLSAHAEDVQGRPATELEVELLEAALGPAGCGTAAPEQGPRRSGASLRIEGWRIESWRIGGFGPEAAHLELDLPERGSSTRLDLPERGDSELLSEALVWALRGGGERSSKGAETEVVVELLAAGGRRRVRRTSRPDGPRSRRDEVLGWDLPAAGAKTGKLEPVASGEREVAAWLDELGLPSAGVLRQSLLAPAASIATALAAGEVPSAEEARFIARRVEERLDHLLVEVESRADALRLRRAEALASVQLEQGADEDLALEDLTERRDEAASRIEALRQANLTLVESAAQSRRLVDAAKDRQARLDQLEAARRRLRAVEAREPEMRRLERELERARRAEALEDQERRLSDPAVVESERAAAMARRAAEEEREAARARFEEAGSRLRQAEDESGEQDELEARLAEIDDLEGVLDLLGRTRDSLARGTEERRRQQERRAVAAAALEDIRARSGAAEESCRRGRAALGDEGSRRLAELRAELEQAEGNLQSVRRLAEAQGRRREVTKIHATTMIHLDRSKRALETEQRQLSRRLDGALPEVEPGSVEVQRDRVAGLRGDIACLEVEAAEQDAAVQDLGGEVLQLRQTLGTLAYAEAGPLEKEVASLRERLEEAGEPAEALARAEARLVGLEAERSGRQAEMEEAESALRAARAREDSERDMARELESRVPAELRDKAALAEAREGAGRRLQDLRAERAAAESEASAAREALVRAEDSLAGLASAHAGEAARLDRAQSSLGKVVEKAGFVDLADYREARREPAERDRIATEVAATREELEAARAAHAELEGRTRVPVLRDGDRTELEQEEWERRQRERKERLQAERVHRDREMLEGLVAQLEQEVEHARAEGARLEEAGRSLSLALQATEGHSEALRGLRERHATLSALADLAAGRLGPEGGFGGFLAACLAEETAARAGWWCRELTADGLHLALEPGSSGWSAELREVRGRGRRGLADAPEEERWLAGLCFALGRADAALVLEGAGRPETLVTDRLPEGLEPAALERLEAWLSRLRASGRTLVLGVADASAPHFQRARGAATGHRG